MATSWVTPTPVMSSFVFWCHVFFGTSLSSGTWYCQVHHSAGDVVCISSLDMSKPTKTAAVHNIVDRLKVYNASDFLVSHVVSSRLDTPRIPRSIFISVVAIFILLVTFISHNGFIYLCFEPGGNLPVIHGIQLSNIILLPHESHFGI